MKLNLSKILAVAAAVLGLIAILMMFAPMAVSESVVGKTEYTGLNTIFGAKYKSEVLGQTIETEVFKFSFVNFLPLILALVGLVCSVMAILGKGGKVVSVVGAVAYLAAGIIFFCAVQGVVFAGEPSKEMVKELKKALDLGAGAIVAGIFSVISAIASAAGCLLAKKA